MLRTRSSIAALLIAALPQFSNAQYDALSPIREYDRLVSAARDIKPLNDSPFGENVSMFVGTVNFSATDISLPGNNLLPVSLGRRFSIADRGYWASDPSASPERNNWFLGGFKDWDLDIAYVQGTFPVSGWIVNDSNPSRRCSAGKPPYIQDPYIQSSSFWQGTTLYIPGYGANKILLANPGYPTPSDGASYPWVTSNGIRIGCTSQTKNGYPGEGFVAITPEGHRYYLDWAVEREAPRIFTTIGSTPSSYQRYIVQRKNIYLVVSRVEDRFGNWVSYGYSNDLLTQISSNDGRRIDISYSGANISQASTSSRVWRYNYSNETSQSDGGLQEVILPSGEKWTYSKVGKLRYAQESSSIGEPGDCLSGLNDDPSPFQYQVVHPSGAAASFSFIRAIEYRYGQGPGGICDRPKPAFYSVRRILSKHVSGMAIENQITSYVIGTNAYPAPVGQRWSEIAYPDGSKAAYLYGRRYWNSQGEMSGSTYDEGLLLETRRISAQGNLLRREAYSYIDNPGQTTPFQRSIGNSFTSDSLSSFVRPLSSREIVQDGVTFTTASALSSFDHFARATSVVESNSLGYGRTRTTSFLDNLNLWVIGLKNKTTIDGTASYEVIYDNTYYLPIVVKQFDKIVQTLTYDTASTVDSGQRGTVKIVKDGNNNITTYTNWKRGIPQLIKYPGTPEAASGATKSAEVDSNGWIRSIIDETGSKTCYDYDPMGRIKEIIYPSETQVGICNTSKWTATTINFSSGHAAAYGMPAGHWRQTTHTGNGRKILIFDALWRPIVEQTLDLGDVDNTLSVTFKRYDSAGRLAFHSYPVRAYGTTSFTDSTLKGTHTTHDALDRVTQLKQDWEGAGQLTTTTEYLSGFKTRVTDPRNQQTTTSYLAWNSPAYDYPRSISHPLGVFTDIARDAFGKPTQLTRRNAGNTSWQRRYYYYDAHQQLCKSKEVETGITAYGYDGAGNLTWSAAGLPWSSDTTCEYTAATAAARRVDRTYDARNRLKTLTFPDNRGNQSWTYTPDGLPTTISTVQVGVTAPTLNEYTYNRRRLLTSEHQTPYARETWTLTHNYNGNGHLADATYPSGLNVAYAPNALGQPTRAGTFATGVSYHPNGALKQFTYGNGIVHTLTQNARGLPAVSKDAYGSTAFLQDEYAYDQHGNVLAITDAATGRNQRGNRSLTYDALDRLTQAVSPMFGTASYSYDALDNLTRVQVGATAQYAARDHHYCYDAAMRLANVKTGSCSGATVMGLGYDVQGNLANKNGVVHEFDYGNRLRKIGTGQSYTYDGYGRREIETIGTTNPQRTRFMYGLDGQLAYENKASNSNTESIHLGGRLVARRSLPTASPNPLEVVTYQHTDTLGSPVVVTDAGRAVIERTEYEPYGQPGNRSARSGAGYAGHVEDTSGLVYMQQRYYDPQLGLFLSVDPITAYSDPVGMFNRYRYAANNPYRFVDQDGQQHYDLSDAYAEVGSHLSYAIQSHQYKKMPNGPERSAMARFLANMHVSLYGASTTSQRLRLEADTIDGAPTGIVYRRINPKTGDIYVGQAISPERFEVRQGEHDRQLGVQHDYEVLGRATPGTDLDVAEETQIRNHGGLRKNGGEGLVNKRYQMNETRYRASGGTGPPRTGTRIRTRK